MSGNKRVNKIRKIKEDMEGLASRCANKNEEGKFVFRSKQSLARYRELGKSYQHNIKKLKIETESNGE